MYLEHWKLKAKPFENTPDPKFFYNSAQHEEAFARMMYVAKEDKGAGMISGIFGCGKTVLARALHDQLKRSAYTVALVNNPRLDDQGLLKMICRQIGQTTIPNQKADILMLLEESIRNNINDGKKTIIVIDEAHAIQEMNVFEEIRMLLNFQDNDRFLLNLFLLGQPELKMKVESNKQLLQRIAIRYHLEGLSHEETMRYIDHRISVAGGRIEFTSTALTYIFEMTGGIPRRINQLCDMCLFTGFSHKSTRIDEDIAREAVESLEK